MDCWNTFYVKQSKWSGWYASARDLTAKLISYQKPRYSSGYTSYWSTEGLQETDIVLAVGEVI